MHKHAHLLTCTYTHIQAYRYTSRYLYILEKFRSLGVVTCLFIDIDKNIAVMSARFIHAYNFRVFLQWKIFVSQHHSIDRPNMHLIKKHILG